MRSDAARLRARMLLRHHWPAAVGLGIVAGVAGGLVLALATIAKDTGSAVETYVARLDAPEGMAVYCPPGMDMDRPDEAACTRYDPVAEMASIRDRPGVLGVGRGAPTPVFLRPTGGAWTEGFAVVAIDGATPAYGHPEMVAGRQPKLGSADEVIVNEGFLAQHGLRVGDQFELAPVTWDEYEQAINVGTPSAPVRPMQVVGVVRTPGDLNVAAQDNDALSMGEGVLFLGPNWVQAVGPSTFARYQNSLVVDVAPGVDVVEVLRAATPGQVGLVSGESLVEGELAGLDDAVAYEARATWAAAGVAVVAVVLLVGQMLARQARRELDDAAMLRAMGATTGLLVRSTIVRWALSAALAVVVAVLLAALGRSRGPIGVAHRMLGATPFGLEPLLTVTVSLGLVALVLGVGLGVTALASRAHRRGRPVRQRPGWPAVPSVAGMAGLAWVKAPSARERGQVTGVIAGLVVAVAAAVASLSVVASLHWLTDEPQRYGAPWHATVTAALGPASFEHVVDELGRIDGVEAIAGLAGNEGTIGDQAIYVYALSPVPHLPSGIEPVITRGRLPHGLDEVALGQRSMADADVDVGGTVEVTYLERTHPLKVVGEVLVYDNWEDLPGVGAVVDHQFIEEFEPDANISDYVVKFEPHQVEAGVATLHEMFPRLVTEPVVPGGVRNLQRVSSWPALLTLLVALMSLITFMHALMVLVRRQRGQLAVLQALGFRRRQLGATVSWFATALVVPALLVGVPLGIVVGRWGWGILAGNLGVPSVAILPLLAVIGVIVGAAVIANVAAIPLAWRAGRIDSARALRAE